MITPSNIAKDNETNKKEMTPSMNMEPFKPVGTMLNILPALKTPDNKVASQLAKLP